MKPTPVTAERLQKLLDFIIAHRDSYGAPPTFRRMAEAMGVASTSTITYYLHKLEALGCVRRAKGRHAAITVMRQYVPRKEE